MRAVWAVHRGRNGRLDLRSRAYGLYVVALFMLFYVAPGVVLAAERLHALGDDGPREWQAPAVVLVAGLALGAQVLGVLLGPLVLPPFVAHVLASTELRPRAYLTRTALRRLSASAVAIAIPLAFVLVSVSYSGDATQVTAAVLASLGVGLLTSASWLAGQVLRPRGGLVWAAAVLAVAVVALSGPIPPFALVDAAQGETPGARDWAGVLGLLAVTGALLVWLVARTDRLDPRRLEQEAARFSQAQMYAGTGSLHDALDLFRPRPSGAGVAVLRPDGLPRTPLADAARRSVRTPYRLAAAVLALLLGPALTVTALGWTEGQGRIWLTIAGMLTTYAGAGWTGEGWRVLRDELRLPPLLGQRIGGPFLRHLPWPLALAAALTGGVDLLAVGWGGSSGTIVLVVVALTLALSARLLREMKHLLPVDLLVPLPTPFGDLSGMRVLLWQLDGPSVVVAGAVLLAGWASPWAVVVVVVLAWLTIDTALRRVDHPPRLPRLGRREG
ncbi:hypothetical protein GCM10027425_01750 [Alteromonas gracilis]